jgi:hypothetical protein
MKNRGMLAVILVLLCALIAVIPLAVIKDSESAALTDRPRSLSPRLRRTLSRGRKLLEPPGARRKACCSHCRPPSAQA